MRMAAFRTVQQWLEDHGLLLLTDSRFPSVATIVSGSPVKGSWWSHPKAHAIFAMAEALSEHPDAVVAKLLSGKVTYVHRRLWPALLGACGGRQPWQLRGLPEPAIKLLDYVTQKEVARTDELAPGLRPSRGTIGDAVREIEWRVLLHTDEIHTETGAHAKLLESWARWARRSRAPTAIRPVGAANRELEGVVDRINGQFDAAARLPWVSPRRR